MRLSAAAGPRLLFPLRCATVLPGRKGAGLLLGAVMHLAAAQPAAAADLAFTPERFFAGESFSAGEVRTFIFSRQAFTARFFGEASRGGFLLDERFSFPDGERLQRWELRRAADGTYTGTVRTEGENGVLSEARPVAGRLTAGGAVLEYDGYAPGGGGTILHFRHRMTAQPDGTVENRVTISKLGVPLATARVTFAKSPEQLGRK